MSAWASGGKVGNQPVTFSPRCLSGHKQEKTTGWLWFPCVGDDDVGKIFYVLDSFLNRDVLTRDSRCPVFKLFQLRLCVRLACCKGAGVCLCRFSPWPLSSWRQPQIAPLLWAAQPSWPPGTWAGTPCPPEGSPSCPSSSLEALQMRDTHQWHFCSTTTPVRCTLRQAKRYSVRHVPAQHSLSPLGGR